MAKHVFKLPDVGEGVVEGEIVKWNVKPGDTVKEDEPLVELMTDKATVAIPSTVNGKVVSTTGKPGDMIPVGSELIVFEVDGKVLQNQNQNQNQNLNQNQKILNQNQNQNQNMMERHI